jgi:hypothetical protein
MPRSHRLMAAGDDVQLSGGSRHLLNSFVVGDHHVAAPTDLRL